MFTVRLECEFGLSTLYKTQPLRLILLISRVKVQGSGQIRKIGLLVVQFMLAI